MRENQPGLSHERPGHRGSARLVHDSTGNSGRSGQLIGHENKNWIGLVMVKGRLGGKEWTVIVASVAGVKRISHQINCCRRRRNRQCEKNIKRCLCYLSTPTPSVRLIGKQFQGLSFCPFSNLTIGLVELEKLKLKHRSCM